MLETAFDTGSRKLFIFSSIPAISFIGAKDIKFNKIILYILLFIKLSNPVD